MTPPDERIKILIELKKLWTLYKMTPHWQGGRQLIKTRINRRKLELQQLEEKHPELKALRKPEYNRPLTVPYPRNRVNKIP